MYIKIDNVDDIPVDLLDQLKHRIFIDGMSYVSQNRHKLPVFDEYFDQIFISPRKIRAYDIIVSGLRNVIIEKTQGGIHIVIDRNVKIPMTRNITLYSVCMLIDQGNLELKPFPVFSTVFDNIKNNFENIITQYYYGVL